MKVVLLANGPIRDYDAVRPVLALCDYIIACDGGLKHARALGVTPDCVIGDMDSVPRGLLSELIERGTAVLTYPTDKDETDMELGMSLALEKNATSIVILGALDGRLDHTLSNIHALTAALTGGIPTELLDERTSVRVIDRECELYKSHYETVSLIPLTTEVTGIITQGLRYPLYEETLKLGTTRGVSNRFTEEKASVKLKEGILLVICAKED